LATGRASFDTLANLVLFGQKPWFAMTGRIAMRYRSLLSAVASGAFAIGAVALMVPAASTA